MMKRLFVSVLCALAIAGCTTTSQTQWSPTVDTYGNSRAQYLTRDTEECRALAMQASGPTNQQAAQAAVMQGLLGAAAGAAVGAVVNRDNWRGARRGAAVGGAVGAIAGGMRTANESDAEFRRTFSNCMRRRGHNVLN